jgi:hypothetical protein
MGDNQVRAGVQRPEQRAQRQRIYNATNRFDFDHSKIPPGVTYEWKALRVGGMEDRESMIQAEMNGWEPVPAGRHPELVGLRRAKEEPNAPIERGSQLLMQLPTEWYQQNQEQDQFAAAHTLESQIARLGLEGRRTGGGRGGVRRERRPTAVEDVVE